MIRTKSYIVHILVFVSFWLAVVVSSIALKKKGRGASKKLRTFLETMLFEKLLLDSGIDKTNDVVDVVLDFLSTKKRIISCDFFSFHTFRQHNGRFLQLLLKASLISDTLCILLYFYVQFLLGTYKFSRIDSIEL